MDFHNLTFGLGLLVSAFCTLIVFAVLVSIAYLVDITAFFAKGRRKREEGPAAPAEDPGLEPEEVDSRTAAVALAALLAYTGSGSRFVIRKIERQRAPLSDWEAAGLRDSVRRPS